MIHYRKAISILCSLIILTGCADVQTTVPKYGSPSKNIYAHYDYGYWHPVVQTKPNTTLPRGQKHENVIKHKKRRHKLSLAERMTIDHYSEELITDPRIKGPIGIRMKFTVHAPEELSMRRGVFFVWVGPKRTDMITGHSDKIVGQTPINLHAIDWDNFNFQSRQTHGTSYNEDITLVFARVEKDGAFCVHSEQRNKSMAIGKSVFAEYAIAIPKNPPPQNGPQEDMINLSDQLTAIIHKKSILQGNPSTWKNLYHTISEENLIASGWKSCVTEKSKWFYCYCNDK